MKINDKFENCAGVYVFTCLANGKQYVGETVSIRDRMSKHKCCGKKETIPFKEDLEKHGWDAFDVYVEYLPAFDKESLIDLEEQMILKFKTLTPDGYNTKPRGQIINFSEESRRKMSESQTGRTHSTETRKKISEAAKGRTTTDETRKKMSQSQKGRTATEETRKKMRESGKLAWEKRKAQN